MRVLPADKIPGVRPLAAAETIARVISGCNYPKVIIRLANYGLLSRCDGYEVEEMTVKYALYCKKGGLVHTRHDVVADEWRNLCGTGFSFG